MMVSVGVRIGALAVALVVGISAAPSRVGAQQADLGEEAGLESAAQMAPTMFGVYGGSITFQGNGMSAEINNVVQQGKNFSGDWLLGPDLVTSPTEVGPFKGKLILKGKLKATMTLQFPNDSFPHCEIKLAGTSMDDGFSFTGSAREIKCGKDGKDLGKGTFFLTAG